jgi:hypothetical protein
MRKTKTSLYLNRQLIQRAKQTAREEGKSFSKWIQKLMRDALSKQGEMKHHRAEIL